MKKIIIVAAILAILGLGFISIMSSQNGAITREEQVNTAKADITVQYKRRSDLLVNLADAVKSYNEHEAKIFISIAEGRTPEGKVGEVNASTYVKAVAERYPELKSNENYKNYMLELSMTENKIAQVRENYNAQVKEYKRYTRKFPTSTFLGLVGYEIQDYEYLNYQSASEDAPKNLL